uniref:ankyrin repeat domain-containing protein n=1 Tax=Moraxella catarrhalis TaxID=480 RepID=UPI001954D1AC
VYGMTPLHYAMRSKNADAAIALLEAGADPNIPNKDGLRPLSMVGYTKDRLDVLELMFKKGGNVHNIMGDGSNRTILESWLPTENEEQWVFDIYNLMKKYAQNF